MATKAMEWFQCDMVIGLGVAIGCNGLSSSGAAVVVGVSRRILNNNKKIEKEEKLHQLEELI